MAGRMNRAVFERMIQEDLKWLRDQPRSFARDHIDSVLRHVVDKYYPEPKIKPEFETEYPLIPLDAEHQRMRSLGSEQ